MPLKLMPVDEILSRLAAGPGRIEALTDYLMLDFAPSLQAFAASREALLAVLRGLPPAGWLRTGTASGWGGTYHRVVHKEADALARHERPHLKQIEAIVSTMCIR